MTQSSDSFNPFERLLQLFTKVRPGEGVSVALFFLQGFLLMFAYYIIRTLREAFILSEFSAEVRSYAVAAIAGMLFIIVPIYSALSRRLGGTRLVQVITLFFASNLLIFDALAWARVPLALPFFIWVSIFGVTVVAQFWAFAADTYNLKSGQRLFPVIMIGVNLGALAGARTASWAMATLGAPSLMLVGTLALIGTVFFCSPARKAVPEGSRSLEPPHKSPETGHWAGGFGLIFRDSYLRLVALYVVFLNWISSTGDFILADVVSNEAAKAIAAGETTLTERQFIGTFYGDFFFWLTLIGLLIQMFLVSRVFRKVGIKGAILVMPTVVVLGYGVIVFVPIFTIIRLIRILERALDYSLANTTRQALFLPTTTEAKYEAKTTIDTFFWRFGDLIQAGIVFAGINWFNWGTIDFAVLVFVLGIVWWALSFKIGQQYREMARVNVTNVAPELNRPIPALEYTAGQQLEYRIARDTFVDADPGDVLTLSARLGNGEPLPAWLAFDPERFLFSGIPPGDLSEALVVEVTATDVDGFSASTTFPLKPG